MISPAALDSFNRIESHRGIDVHSYVLARGSDKYALVKSNRRQALLERARQRSPVLDDATRRKTTNIASAEASRAKKQFILDELFRQLRAKTADSLVLASEIRRLSLLLEKKTIDNHILITELQKHRAMWTTALSTTFAAPPDPSPFVPHPVAAQFEHATHQPQTLPFESSQPFQPQDDTNPLQSVHSPPVPDDALAAGADEHEAVHIDISEMEQVLKSQPILSSSTLDYTYAEDHSKPLFDPLAPLPLHATSTESSQLASFNPSDQFTVAG